MDTIQASASGKVTVALAAESVAEVKSVGYVSRAVFVDALSELTALCAANPKVTGLLWNTFEVEGNEAGNTALALKWIAQQIQIRRVAVVARSQSHASLVHLGRVMIVGLDTRAFRDANEAMAWFATPLTSRGRARSGRFRAA